MTRSFTLLETIVAAALLAMLAASSLGALRGIALATDRAGAAIDVGAFSLLVDELLAEPQDYGLPELADGAAWHGLRVRHPRYDANIFIRRATPESPVPSTVGAAPRRYAWLIFESQGAAVARWLPFPEPKEPAP